MLRTLRDLFNAVLPPQAGPAVPDEHALQLATAVLLVEVMRASAEIGEAERSAVLAALDVYKRQGVNILIWGHVIVGLWQIWFR